MGVLKDDSFEKSLKCDFPARETFSEALLEDLLAMNEQELQVASADHVEKPQRAAKVVKLGEAELQMLAAAEGETPVHGDAPDWGIKAEWEGQ